MKKVSRVSWLIVMSLFDSLSLSFNQPRNLDALKNNFSFLHKSFLFFVDLHIWIKGHFSDFLEIMEYELDI